VRRTRTSTAPWAADRSVMRGRNGDAGHVANRLLLVAAEAVCTAVERRGLMIEHIKVFRVPKGLRTSSSRPGGSLGVGRSPSQRARAHDRDRAAFPRARRR
jgi:hypothetical protein